MSQATAEARGRRVPKIGFGTWQITGRDCEEGVADALALGYRHIDTAAVYDNEEEVGRGIAASGVPRDEIWLTTKVWMDDAPADRVRRSAEGSLRRLGTDYVDLLLLHWPNEDVPLEQTMEALNDLRRLGTIREAGVSNFPPGLWREALELGAFANQVELHPFLAQGEVIAAAEEHDAIVTAYAPLGHGKVPGHPALEEIGREHGKSAGQVALRWLIDQPRTTAVPKASSHERRAENFDVFDFELTDEDREKIAALPKDRRDFSPAWAPDWSA